MSDDGFDLTDRGQFLNLAGLFEGGLLFVGLGLGWIAGISPFDALEPTWRGTAWGIAAILPLLVVFAATYRYPIGPLRPIKRFLIDSLGPSLAVCRWYDLMLLAALAGLSEEVLFRGVLQPWLGRWGSAVGLIGSNVVFGLAHFVTPMYALLAGLIGIYLGLLLQMQPEHNLLAPIVAHAAYDYVAFLVVAAEYRGRQR